MLSKDTVAEITAKLAELTLERDLVTHELGGLYAKRKGLQRLSDAVDVVLEYLRAEGKEA